MEHPEGRTQVGRTWRERRSQGGIARCTFLGGETGGEATGVAIKSKVGLREQMQRAYQRSPGSDAPKLRDGLQRSEKQRTGKNAPGGKVRRKRSLGRSVVRGKENASAKQTREKSQGQAPPEDGTQ